MPCPLKKLSKVALVACGERGGKSFGCTFFPSLSTSFFCHGSSFGKGRLRATRSAYPPPHLLPVKKERERASYFPPPDQTFRAPAFLAPHGNWALGTLKEGGGGDSSGLIFTLPLLACIRVHGPSPPPREGGRKRGKSWGVRCRRRTDGRTPLVSLINHRSQFGRDRKSL